MYVQQRNRDGGLGFPVGLIIMGASAVVGALRGRGKKDEEQATKVNRIEARDFVVSQYRELLGREWFPADGTGYEDGMVNGSCDASCVREGILNSVEYANRKLKQLQQTAPPSTSIVERLIGAAQPDAYGATVAGAGPLLMEYAPYLIGGVVLLMVLRK